MSFVFCGNTTKHVEDDEKIEKFMYISLNRAQNHVYILLYTKGNIQNPYTLLRKSVQSIRMSPLYYTQAEEITKNA